MAEVSKTLCYESPRLTETEFGWSRDAVKLGLNELRTGLECFGHYEVCGKRRSEVDQPQLEKDIRCLVEPESQADPQMKSTFAYTRITAKAVRQKLIEEKGWADDQVPKERTINDILNRLGYKLHRVQKTKPQKKIPETDSIFENVHRVNEEAKNNKKVLRVSIDCKATVNLGDFSRGGNSRGTAPVEALDHDMATKNKLIPFGILNLENDKLYIFYGNSNKTSDFVCDAFEWWWELVKAENPEVEEIAIFSDNGSENNSHRTQYLSRLVRFSQNTGLRLHGVYYPPYHSKYNPIERGWSSLENHWSGTLLNAVSTVVKWTETMTWKAMSPVVNLLDTFYPKGVKLIKSEMAAIEPYIIRNPKLPKWDITIVPDLVVS